MKQEKANQKHQKTGNVHSDIKDAGSLDKGQHGAELDAPAASQNMSAAPHKVSHQKLGASEQNKGLSNDVPAATELQESAFASLFTGQESHIDLRQISHDLNNYLTILMIHCDELRSEFTVNEQRRARFELLHDNLRLAASIVNELTAPENTQPVDIVSFETFVSFLHDQETVWNLLTGGAIKIYMNTDLQQTADINIHIITNYAKRALIQLVRNAAEAVFSPADTSEDSYPLVLPQLDLWLEYEYPEMHLHIKDNGPGIAPQLTTNLFEPGKTTKEGQHRGHGLASAARLAQLWGGNIIHIPTDKGLFDDSAVEHAASDTDVSAGRASARGAHFRLSFPAVRSTDSCN